MSEKRSVAVSIRGRELHVKTAGNGEELQRIASYLDETMAQVERRTGTADSVDIALLTALNLAREVVQLRDGDRTQSPQQVEQLRAIIDLAESALPPETS